MAAAKGNEPSSSSSFVKSKSGRCSGSTSASSCEPCRSFGQKCSHLVKNQRARFYIVRRCIAMLVCWRDRGEP